MRTYLSRDAAAKALGAEDVATGLAAQGVTPMRVGSRGMVWLEPLLEIEIDGVRHAFGPVAAENVTAILADPAGHPKALGPTEEIPFLAAQQRLTFARCGRIDPLSLAEYEAEGGLVGLRRALGMPAEGIVEEVKASGLRGRGGSRGA